ncbi:MAG TPA: FG-GAP-like repeat-containing protein [Pirellulaceae bacterium]|nr:FG-GAP-like repeat-containing protein [Pirellulaceae bacterium]
MSRAGMSRGLVPWVGMILLTLLAAATVWAVRARLFDSDVKLLDEARVALREGEHLQAFELATIVLRRSPGSDRARLYAARSALALGRPGEASELLDGFDERSASQRFSGTTNAKPPGVADMPAEALDRQEADHLAVELHLMGGRPSAAEKRLREALRRHPRDVEMLRHLAQLLTLEGRRWEARPYLASLLAQRAHTLEELILIGDPWPDYESAAELRRFRMLTPDDVAPLIGLARIEVHRNEHGVALDMLREVVVKQPQMIEAHAWLGWTLLQTPQGLNEFDSWERALPTGADEHPMIWLVRGLAADQLQQREAALRCFWEAVGRDPDYDVALFQLARALGAAGHAEEARQLRVRTDQLYTLAARLKRIHSDRADLSRLPGGAGALIEVAKQLESFGRVREALAWYEVIRNYQSHSRVAGDEIKRLSELVRTENDNAKRSRLAALERLDYSAAPLPKWSKVVASVGPASPHAGSADETQSHARSHIKFVDVAESAGLRFSYFNGDAPGDPRLLGTTGGGVGVLDYDGDGWPDIYFTQGCPWPEQFVQTKHRDRLFRNTGDGRFVDVTEQAGLGDEHFSQGIAIGDFDNDGDPDIYLANLGPNRLYANNGDGTFSDVAITAGILNDDWTTSCLIADLNGDGIPDLYEVNYVGGDALTRRCVIRGRPRACSPSLFPEQDDRLFLSSGDGRFADVTKAAGVTGERGKGLGIVAADFDASGLLSLFVANDGTPNFFYHNETPQAGRSASPPSPTPSPLNSPKTSPPTPRFVENGVLSGLAFDRHGNFQACMGVALDDINGDGQLELFVTNFFHESNTLYVADVPGQFYQDRTHEYGLRDGSIEMLGFGAQFTDADLDGWPDLVITNGHVQDFSDEGTPFEMRAQFYRNVEGRRFVEMKSATVGPFFDERRLGRGLARLDWNRDGREDVVITHVGSNAALLTNETTGAGRHLVLQLRGVESARDAIGTRVVVETSGHRLHRQLTAGDGYQASNERQLVIGLGDAVAARRIEVRWPSGRVQEFHNVPADASYIVIEGRAEMCKLR